MTLNEIFANEIEKLGIRSPEILAFFRNNYRITDPRQITNPPPLNDVQLQIANKVKDLVSTKDLDPDNIDIPTILFEVTQNSNKINPTNSQIEAQLLKNTQNSYLDSIKADPSLGEEFNWINDNPDPRKKQNFTNLQVNISNLITALETILSGTSSVTAKKLTEVKDNFTKIMASLQKDVAELESKINNPQAFMSYFRELINNNPDIKEGLQLKFEEMNQKIDEFEHAGAARKDDMVQFLNSLHVDIKNIPTDIEQLKLKVQQALINNFYNEFKTFVGDIKGGKSKAIFKRLLQGIQFLSSDVINNFIYGKELLPGLIGRMMLGLPPAKAASLNKVVRQGASKMKTYKFLNDNVIVNIFDSDGDENHPKHAEVIIKQSALIDEDVYRYVIRTSKGLEVTHPFKMENIAIKYLREVANKNSKNWYIKPSSNQILANVDQQGFVVVSVGAWISEFEKVEDNVDGYIDPYAYDKEMGKGKWHYNSDEKAPALTAENKKVMDFYFDSSDKGKKTAGVSVGNLQKIIKVLKASITGIIELYNKNYNSELLNVAKKLSDLYNGMVKNFEDYLKNLPDQAAESDTSVTDNPSLNDINERLKALTKLSVAYYNETENSDFLNFAQVFGDSYNDLVLNGLKYLKKMEPAMVAEEEPTAEKPVKEQPTGKEAPLTEEDMAQLKSRRETPNEEVSSEEKPEETEKVTEKGLI